MSDHSVLRPSGAIALSLSRRKLINVLTIQIDSGAMVKDLAIFVESGTDPIVTHLIVVILVVVAGATLFKNGLGCIASNRIAVKFAR